MSGPSGSVIVSVTAVSVSPWVAVPLMVTDPVGASLTFATAAVAAEVSDSAAPPSSVQLTVTVIAAPTSACSST